MGAHPRKTGGPQSHRAIAPCVVCRLQSASMKKDIQPVPDIPMQHGLVELPRSERDRSHRAVCRWTSWDVIRAEFDFTSCHWDQ